MLIIALEKHTNSSISNAKIPYEEWSPRHDWLCKLLLVANVVSIEEGFGRESTWTLQDTATLLNIHEVLLGEVTEVPPKHLENIDSFCERWLDRTASPFTRQVAIALARLSYTWLPGFTESIQSVGISQAFKDWTVVRKWRPRTEIARIGYPLPLMNLSYIWGFDPDTTSGIFEHPALWRLPDQMRMISDFYPTGPGGSTAHLPTWISPQLVSGTPPGARIPSAPYKTLARMSNQAIWPYIVHLEQRCRIDEVMPEVKDLTTGLRVYKTLLFAPVPTDTDQRPITITVYT